MKTTNNKTVVANAVMNPSTSASETSNNTGLPNSFFPFAIFEIER